MASRIERDSLELLTKENERFRLQRLGFILDLKKEASLLALRFPPEKNETFASWKSRCLREYYRLKGFGIFCRENIDNPEFEATVRQLMRLHLIQYFQSAGPTTTDRHLAPDSDTVSYALSDILFQEIYTLSFSAMPTFGNTSELDGHCRKLAEENFPVEEPRIIGFMKDNDNFYWNKFYRKLRPITAAFCYQMSGISGDNNTHDIWSDTCMSVNKAVTEGRMKDPVDSKAILSYSIGIIKNKNKELARLKSKTPADIDTVQYKLADEQDEKYFNLPETNPDNFPSQIDSLSTYIDFTDKDSVQGYFIVILYNKEHPLHEMLVKGYEDKVERMFEHYIDGLSYEEIVSRHYGITGGKEAVKECARLRQEIKRLKKSLLDRFEKLVEKYR